MNEAHAGAAARPAARRAAAVVAVLAAGVIALNLLAQGLDRAVGGNQPGGVHGSSYATGTDGAAAYASLLARYGHRVLHQRGRIIDRPPPPEMTFAVIEPQVVSDDDAAALLQFVTDGGRLVVAARAPAFLRHLRDQPPRWAATGRTAWRAIDPGFSDARVVETEAAGAWVDAGTSRPIVGDRDRALITYEEVGRGEVLYVADPSLLENAFLARGDNAALAVDLAGRARRPVMFAEGVHGFGTARGLRAIPARWKVALGLLAAAGLCFVWARARRFGPPDRAARELPPPRFAYVQALALALERTRDPQTAFAPLRRFGRAQVASRAGLDARASDEAVARAATALGCAPAEADALVAARSDGRDLIELGRAIARVTTTDGSLE